ncbi:methylamine utilization [Cyanophage S-TIM4]|uniref:Methylamine utilization protein n=2 Tax=Thaumasvirus stim4 TaxID=2734148 RepID=A0A345AWJ7_9CAUD|nr:methylamine utilization [Prochlorococcus phage P-RSM4]YP_009806401.1 methylamine utilization [Cyanophage S-TIM4]ADO98532.1 methylamine utilization protein [Prochlorococcus phage P-RSM4]AXF41280.1 methylamine utilization protein [Cyanophage S-TIM4]|tara:strand:- start:64 stop:489 length:426 start_codon:yes stop_codon:yes gene_type:complete
MINYAKHDEEFHGIFKLVSGEEILAKAVMTEDRGESLIFMSDPVSVLPITKDVGEQKILRGMGFSKWIPMSDEEFFILREKDIMTMATMSRPVKLMYDAYIIGEDAHGKQMKERQVPPSIAEGYLGNTKDIRALLEKLYKK